MVMPQDKTLVDQHGKDSWGNTSWAFGRGRGNGKGRGEGEGKGKKGGGRGKGKGKGKKGGKSKRW